MSGAAGAPAVAAPAGRREARLAWRVPARVALIGGGAVLLAAATVAVIMWRLGVPRWGGGGGRADSQAAGGATAGTGAGEAGTATGPAGRRASDDRARVVTAVDGGATTTGAASADLGATGGAGVGRQATPTGEPGAQVAGAHRKRVPIVVDYEAPPRRRHRGAAPPAPTAPPAGPDLEAARDAYRQATQKYWYGDFGAAEELYRKAIAAYPGYAAGYRGLGLLHARLGNNARAIEAYNRYLKMAPGARDAGQIRERLGKLQTQ